MQGSCLQDGESRLDLQGAKVDVVAGFLPASKAIKLFDELISTLDWQEREIVFFGRRYLQPRLIAWHGTPQATYRYSGQTYVPAKFTQALVDLKQQVQERTQSNFNSVLANLYRCGKDSMGYHADDESELGSQPVIASLSLGCARQFVFRSRQKPRQYCRFELGAGDLLVMRGHTQRNWQHGILKTSENVGPRINLTYRYIFPRR
jgi:alkylated DNA repair dioxygenase AlkB